MSATTDSTTSPHSGHRARLRERLKRDPLAVADYEVLELLLGYGLTRKDTKLLAKELLRRFGTIRGALDARPDELLQVPGFGPGLMALWRVQRELLARYASSAARQREILATPDAVARMAQSRLAGCPHEECWLALVDARNGLIFWERLRRGGIGQVPVQPRDVLEAALTHKASGIILVHNHPGGSPGPSQPDLMLTTELQRLAPRMGLRFLDHVIVTEGDCYSITQSKRI
ncbi:MAG: DNA repair protein RadC [Desulfovibrio sp.]|uniref:JAB domain-containing protein n=1 Tax=Desulfovibrio sp. TaxID=885 RepID=UPI00258ACDD5|nr:DNA repair protein RadC [Desulfovibrio sp.]MCD7983060.1 DNA repair protein RadC [Desulfovibrio sp.]